MFEEMNRRRGVAVVAFLSVVALGMAGTQVGSPADDSAEARRIVEHADRANTPPAMIETARMVITDENGATYERRLRVWSKQKEGGDLDLMRFFSPDEIRGAGLLTHEHRGGDDDQWFYLPATRKIRRIAGADRRNRFMGTEFLYQDLQGYHPENYNYQMLESETVDGESCHVIEAVPIPDRADRSAYSKETLWIGKRTAVLRKAVMYDEKGERLKELTTSGIREVRKGIYLPDRITISNVQNDRSTLLETIDRELPGDLSNEMFSQRELRRRLRPNER